jgi:hypothetical protein
VKRCRLRSGCSSSLTRAMAKSSMEIQLFPLGSTSSYGRVLCGLHHNRIAERQCGRDGAMRQVHRKVPRADNANHAERLKVRPAFFARFVEQKNSAFDSMRKRRGFQRNCLDVLPLKFGLDASAAILE